MRGYIKRAIERHAIREYPRESCGLVVATGRRMRYIECENVAESDSDFKICPRQYAEIEDEHQVLAVVHSHIDMSAAPSEADKVGCEATGLPWHIVSIQKNPEDDRPRAVEWRTIEPIGYEAPLVGRTFHHGVLDCYTLIRDFYRRELGIVIPDFERPDYWWDKPECGELYLDNFESAGFARVDGEPKYGDVLLIQYRSERVNHGGVYIGSNTLKTQPDLHPISEAMLHHAMPMLSERVVYASYWRDNTRMIVRHKEMM